MDRNADAVTISVVVACFDRMGLLRRTLAALAEQVLPAGVIWEVIIADNHPDQLAADTPPMPGLTIRHIPAAPFRNIAAARNRGVEAARGRFVAFLDDDEAPEPECLAQHLAALEASGADASFGPKFPIFEGGAAPGWDPQAHFYTVDFGLAAGAALNPLNWWSASGRGLGTGNAMLRVATCLDAPLPFDETMGRSGGEDSLLFFRLAKQGRRFIWTPSARVVEINQTGRQTAAYMRERLWRSARHSRMARLAVGDNRMLTALGIIGIGLAQVVVHGGLWLLTRGAMRHRFGVAKGLGKLGLGGDLDFIPEPPQG
ncbi:succinoglycan biosynthesis protein ExoM [Humitalea rosea]|uniref:Succinoglycan biosynthesis protein ExoM n=1 Tax=Humitalea rosea TaxID=990373 RepID=A0A2W7IP53_9PROT|nr:glycosyltransferase family 2 protein [Humitalea rosea]PZW40423.1 succinoglycan biosynthesis protein ExoM [Humitalea rosea]